MGMSIDELKAYCMEQEYNHRLRCKQYDNASGYTRSQNKDIRTACAVREELLGDYYQQIAQTLRKYQMMQSDYEARLKADLVAVLTEILLEAEENTVRWYVGRVDGKSDDVVLMETLQEIIQQKINSIKAESEDT